MFRGRPRRPGGRAMIRLNHAHHLMNDGQYLQAAHNFEELAEGAVQRRIPRAPFLFIQAGRAYLLGNKKALGAALIKRGLKMLADARRWGELSPLGHRLIEELRSQGFEAEGGKLEVWLSRVLPRKSDQVGKMNNELKSHTPLLPTYWPHCGGAINSKEVTWIDERTAECLYCGSSIRAEI